MHSVAQSEWAAESYGASLDQSSSMGKDDPQERASIYSRGLSLTQDCEDELSS